MRNCQQTISSRQYSVSSERMLKEVVLEGSDKSVLGNFTGKFPGLLGAVSSYRAKG